MPKQVIAEAVDEHAPGGSDARGSWTSNAHDAWLRQVTEVREAALRLMRNRFTSDIEAARHLFGGKKSTEVERQAEYAKKLTADYLAESENLFELCRVLTQHRRV